MQTKGQIHKGAGQIRSFPPWRQRERSRVTYIHRSECSKKGMVFRNTRLSSFTRSHVVPNLHDLLFFRRRQRKLSGWMFEKLFFMSGWWYKATTDKKSIINIRGVTVHKHYVWYVPQFWCHSSVWGKINKTASFFTLSSGFTEQIALSLNKWNYNYNCIRDKNLPQLLL